MDKKLNVLSLFDGISGAQLALKKLGIDCNYYASEIDKYAISVTQNNFPNTIQIGDINKINIRNLPDIDLLIGGSPCQGFSFAGKQLNFNDPRSMLFFEYIRLLKELKPKYFLLENVKMKQEYRDIISKYLSVNFIEIDSALVSAQSRKRLYWTNLKVEQPMNKEIYLKDILERDMIEAKRYTRKNGLGLSLDKSFCLTASDWRGLNRNQAQVAVITDCNIEEKINLKCVQFGIADEINGHDICKRVYSEEGKSPAVKTMQSGNTHPKVAIDELYYRRLIPLECERLQCFDDGWTEYGIDEIGKEVKISNSQRYKMLGNAFTVDVIAHILSSLPIGSEAR